VDGKIILWEAESYFTTKKTAKDLQSFLKRTDDSLLGWRLRAVSEMHDHNGTGQDIGNACGSRHG
jgi:hypothetical protein